MTSQAPVAAAPSGVQLSGAGSPPAEDGVPVGQHPLPVGARCRQPKRDSPHLAAPERGSCRCLTRSRRRK